MPFPPFTEAEEFESRAVTKMSMVFAWEEAAVQSGNIVNVPL